MSFRFTDMPVCAIHVFHVNSKDYKTEAATECQRVTVQWVVAGTGGRAAEGRDCPVGCCRDGTEGSRGQGLSSGLLPGRDGGQPRAGTVQWVVAGTGRRAGTVQWVVAGTGRRASEDRARAYRGWSRDRAG